MTPEEKARRYDEALARARKLQKNSNGMILKKWLWNIFPELKESRDNRIMKVIRGWIYTRPASFFDNGISKEEILAWLEKQGKQEEPQVYETKDGEVITYSETNGYKIVEPKFHEGDWVVTDKNNVVQIKEIEDSRYVLENAMKFSVCYVDKCWRKWTIQDAKDGDVLATDKGSVFIYAKVLHNKPYAYCGVDKFGVFKDNCLEHHWTGRPVFPATKEQRDLLFQKMKEAGYIFDFKNKEFKKIETEIEIPFGAKDSELQEATYYIPKGFYAEIDNDKVVIKKGEKSTSCLEKQGESDETKAKMFLVNKGYPIDANGIFPTYEEMYNIIREGLEKQVSQKPTEWSEDDEHRVKDTIYFLDTAKKHYASTVELDACIDWLKSLSNKE